MKGIILQMEMEVSTVPMLMVSNVVVKGTFMVVDSWFIPLLNF